MCVSCLSLSSRSFSSTSRLARSRLLMLHVSTREPLMKLLTLHETSAILARSATHATYTCPAQHLKRRPLSQTKGQKVRANFLCTKLFRNPSGLRILDGSTIRNANRGDSRESIRRETPIFITFERFARIASNL